MEREKKEERRGTRATNTEICKPNAITPPLAFPSTSQMPVCLPNRLAEGVPAKRPSARLFVESHDPTSAVKNKHISAPIRHFTTEMSMPRPMVYLETWVLNGRHRLHLLQLRRLRPSLLSRLHKAPIGILVWRVRGVGSTDGDSVQPAALIAAAIERPKDRRMERAWSIS